jgi:hypothetical protein
MLPTSAAASGSGQPRRNSRPGALATYFRRIVKPQQMDFE